MELKRSYRRRGTPDLPMAIYTGTVVINADVPPIPEYHLETELVRVLSGHVVLQLSGVSRTFREGDIFLIPSNTVHCYRFTSEDSLLCTLIFSPDAIAMQPEHFFQKAFVNPLQEERLQLPPLLQPGHPAYNDICTQFDLLQHCKMFEPNYQIRRFSALMAVCTALLPYCTLTSEEKTITDPGNEAVKMCMRYIHNHHTKKITLEDLGQFCHMHPNYLCTLFRNYTGQTIFDYLTRYRIESAAQLLKNQELSAGKVGELAGFHSESLFYRTFKKIMGVTPKTYAKQQKNS